MRGYVHWVLSLVTPVAGVVMVREEMALGM